MDAHDWNWCLNDDETMAADANQATREGWALVNEGDVEARIEKIDCLGILAADGHAMDIVCRSAAEGSEYHAAALEHIRTHNEEEWQTIEARIRDSGVDYLGRPQPAFEDVIAAVDADLTGWLWTGLIERISQDRRSRTCGEVRRRARSRWC